MRKYNILVLTDHGAHNRDNSVYELCAALRRHPEVGDVHLASRGNEANRSFFFDFSDPELAVWPVRRRAGFEQIQRALQQHTIRVDARDYDVVWLRLPRPIPEGFFDFLTRKIDERRILNRPAGIQEVANKAFLINFPELTPPSRWCRTVEEVWISHERFPVVLKPVENYGGRGIIRLRRGMVHDGRRVIPFGEYLPVMEEQLAKGGYLAMKYMKNVRQGDKRIVVTNGEVVGAALRLPPKGSWICNAAQGGKAVFTEADERERAMIARLNEVLLPKGIAMYGIDTLVGDDGHRTLSEINALSIGGIKPMAELSGLPLIRRAADLLMDYVTNHVGDRQEAPVIG